MESEYSVDSDNSRISRNLSRGQKYTRHSSISSKSKAIKKPSPKKVTKKANQRVAGEGVITPLISNKLDVAFKSFFRGVRA